MRTHITTLGIVAMTFVVAACGSDDTDNGAPGGAAGQGGSAGSGGADWSCLPTPTGNPPAGDTLDLPLKLVGYQGMKPLEGLTVRVCQMADRDCANPVTEGTSDANGEVTVQLPMGTTGFVGYGEITGGDILPTIGMANVPIVTERLEPVQIVLVKESELRMLVTVLGGTFDETRGHLSVYAWDCAQKLAPGASIQVDSPATDTGVFYFDDEGMPVKDATSTASFGLAGSYNVPVGDVTLSATVTATGAPMGKAATFTRAGWLTSVVFLPTPQ